MRKLLLMLTLLPAIALANPKMFGEPPCGDMPPKHHGAAGGGERLPGFLHQIDLSEKQQTEIKTLLKAHHAEIDANLQEARKIGTEIHRLSFSNDYSDAKIQSLFDKAAAIHRETALRKSGLDNAIFKLLSGEQQQKLQAKMAHLED